MRMRLRLGIHLLKPQAVLSRWFFRKVLTKSFLFGLLLRAAPAEAVALQDRGGKQSRATGVQCRKFIALAVPDYRRVVFSSHGGGSPPVAAGIKW